MDQHRDEVDVLLSDLGLMINSPLLSDLSILTRGGTQISAHGCILVARCPGFRWAVQVKSAPPRVLDLSEFAYESVLAYLEIIYCASTKSEFLEDCRRKEVETISIK